MTFDLPIEPRHTILGDVVRRMWRPAADAGLQPWGEQMRAAADHIAALAA